MGECIILPPFLTGVLGGCGSDPGEEAYDLVTCGSEEEEEEEETDDSDDVDEEIGLFAGATRDDDDEEEDTKPASIVESASDLLDLSLSASRSSGARGRCTSRAGLEADGCDDEGHRGRPPVVQPGEAAHEEELQDQAHQQHALASEASWLETSGGRNGSTRI